MPGNRCSNCIAYSFDCTYVEAAKKRGPPKGYVERLETRIEKLEKILTRIYPEGNVLKELDAMDAESFIQKFPRAMVSAGIPKVMRPRHPCEIATSVIRSVGTPPADLSHDDDFAHVMLADEMRRLAMDTPEKNRFFGKSSGVMLVHAAMELKHNLTGGPDDTGLGVLSSMREEFWKVRPWERSGYETQKVRLDFPEPDLLEALIKLYFEEVNIILPLLHRPTFEREVAEGLHFKDNTFGANVLLVCAVASRYSDDPRILLDGYTSWHSGGWKWYRQVQNLMRSYLEPPTLHELQYYCLSVMFLQGSSAPQSCWTMVGVGIRLAQDVGAHRRKYNRHTMTVEDELWKRGFWVLVTMDRSVSSALGRPCAIQDEDFDVDFPVECDDEYWENPDPAKRFKQPLDKPSYVTGFVLLLKLNQIMTILLRTIYSINKSKIILGFVGNQWEQHIVAELDSALNKWVDAVPEFLRWDPTREDTTFLQLSASLYTTYYYIQILIHRSFIPSPRKPSPLSFPSLAICTNAARSCSHIVDVYRRRGFMAPGHMQISIFTAGLVLLLNIWGGKRGGLSTDPSKEMNDVHKCMQALRVCESRWHSAGRLWDIMYELASVSELPLPRASPPASNKRERGADSPTSSSPNTNTTNSPNYSGPETPRIVAGSRRVASHAQSKQHETAPFPLPLYSNELGRYPMSLPGPTESRPTSQGAMSTFWGASEPLPPGDSSTFPQSPAAQLPFNMDLYHQMGGYDAGLLQALSSSGGMNGMQQLHSFEGNSNMNGDGGGQTMMMPAQGMFGNAHISPMQALIDSDTVAMWSNVSTGFELDQWGTYLTNVSELTHGMYNTTPGG